MPQGKQCHPVAWEHCFCEAVAHCPETFWAGVKCGLREKSPQVRVVNDADSGGTLEEAWYTMNGLSDNSNYEKPEQDMGFTNLQTYLKGPSSWRESRIFLLIAVGSLLAGTVVAYFGFAD